MTRSGPSSTRNTSSSGWRASDSLKTASCRYKTRTPRSGRMSASVSFARRSRQPPRVMSALRCSTFAPCGVFLSSACPSLQQGPPQHHARHTDVDDQTGDVNQRRHEGGRGAGGIKTEPPQNKRQSIELGVVHADVVVHACWLHPALQKP